MYKSDVSVSPAAWAELNAAKDHVASQAKSVESETDVAITYAAAPTTDALTTVATTDAPADSLWDDDDILDRELERLTALCLDPFYEHSIGDPPPWVEDPRYETMGHAIANSHKKRKLNPK
jgi:hypothetical protein